MGVLCICGVCVVIWMVWMVLVVLSGCIDIIVGFWNMFIGCVGILVWYMVMLWFLLIWCSGMLVVSNVCLKEKE